MGLDMYVNDDDGELLYWRKEPAIHSWFEELALDKDIEFDSFNCIPVPLVKDDILKLRMDINNDNLNMSATGFFFGNHGDMDLDDYKDWKKDRLQECETMINSLSTGNTLTYDSWW